MSKLGSRFGIFVILLAVAAGVGFALNPSKEDHKAKLYTAIQKKVGGGGLLATLGAEAAKRADALELAGIEYKNYMVFSTVKRNGEIVTIGAFGKVYVVDDSVGLE
ncbi:MAG: hypothetical protein QGH94_04290 [Phycisphaerae bacterium]|jgi:hypothetical protein|nr:hypothetical protein [Phycisphaerae bacterium]MDP7287194.1 hypothetical protein [Phycisphaerae bacterium]